MTAWRDVDASKLRRGDLLAWTSLLRLQPEWAAATARRVKTVAMQRGWSGAALFKYQVLLDNGEVLTFVGKQVKDDEARALEILGQRTPVDIPHVYFAQDGWSVMEALPPGKPPDEWKPDHVRVALANLARLHAAFWDCAPDWLGKLDAVGLDRQLDNAARGLELIERVGGWPGLIEPGLMRAMHHVLDHRQGFIAPLLGQPVTLLHGDAWMPNWNIAEERCALLDWGNVVAGPAAWDLNYFLEIAAVYKVAEGQWRICFPPMSRDAVVTYYLDELERALRRKVDRTAFTSALPAAFVVNTLTLWMGYAADYYAWTNVMLAAGWLLARLPRPLRRTLEGLTLQNQGDFLRQTFARFESYVGL